MVWQKCSSYLYSEPSSTVCVGTVFFFVYVFSLFFFFKQKTAYEIMPSLVGSEMCIRDRIERYGKRAAGDDRLVVDYLSDEVARSEVLPDHSPFFIKGVVFILAGRCALKLASSPQLAAALEAQGESFLRKALHGDACQHSSNDQDPLVEILNSSIF